MRICIIGCLDTKGAECDYLKKQLEKNHTVIMINTGIYQSTFKANINIQQIVGNENNALLAKEIESKNLSNIIELICNHAFKTIPKLIETIRIDAVIGMGGANGTKISTTIMRLFPPNTRKICISTLAPSHLDLNKFAADKIEMVPAIVDICGLNIITQNILNYVTKIIELNIPAFEFKPTNYSTELENAINFLKRYLELFNIIPELQNQANKIIAITSFGNTTICVEACHKQLIALGYQVIIFHATGTGGEIMRYLIEQQCIKAGVLDVTTTELADLICDGSMSSSRERFYAPTNQGIPHLIAPGCLDMVNFIPKLPAKYAHRKCYVWSDQMQLMRTDKEENILMGKFLAEIANQAKTFVEFVLPTGGFSRLGQQENFFHDNEADIAFIATIKEACNNDILTIIPQHINHAEVSDTLVRRMHVMIQKFTKHSIKDLPHLHTHNTSSTTILATKPSEESNTLARGM